MQAVVFPVGPYEEIGVASGVVVQLLGELLHQVAGNPRRSPIDDRSFENLVHVEQGSLLADDHPAAHEIPGQRPGLQATQQMRFARSEVPGHQHPDSGLGRLRLVGRSGQQGIEIPLDGRLVAPQDGDGIPIGDPVSQGLQSPTIFQHRGVYGVHHFDSS